jgi:hypothetical protein
MMTAPLLGPAEAEAQFPLYQLPKDDFIWHWGDTREEAERRGFADFDVSGSEASFRCELTAQLHASSTMNPQEINQIENDLRTRLDFIYAASEAMNYLDRMRALDWAVLDCKQFEPGPVDEAERAEREDRAREKMQREIERRRARSAPDDAAE